MGETPSTEIAARKKACAEAHFPSFLVFDTETNGRSPQLVIQLAYIVFDKGGYEMHRDSRLVKLPAGSTISSFARTIHHIDEEELLRNGHEAHDVFSHFFFWAEKVDRVVAHNAAFDLAAIAATCDAHELKFDNDALRSKSFCTMRASMPHTNLVNKAGRPKWAKNTELFSILTGEAPKGRIHNAIVDTEITARNYKEGKRRGWW